MIVVKLGGSLFDHPNLGPGLRWWIAERSVEPMLLVVGGGGFADVIRHLDRVHGLGEAVAHQLALTSLRASAEFVRVLIGRPPHVELVDAERFCDADLTLPHTWNVTTDSIAARVAVVRQARQLVLLKSVDIPPGLPWAEAARRGWVDDYFPEVIAASNVPLEVVNFRRYLDEPEGRTI